MFDEMRSHQRLHGVSGCFFLASSFPQRSKRSPFVVNDKSFDADAKDEPCLARLYWPALVGNKVLFVPLLCCSEFYSTAHAVGVGERLSDGLTLAGFLCPPLCFLSSLINPSGVLLLCRSRRSETVCVLSLG